MLAADAFEPNNDRPTVDATLPGWAYQPNLGVINGTRTIGSNVDIGSLTLEDPDWYRFETTGTGTGAHGVTITFANTLTDPGDQDLDLELYDDNNTLLDSSLTPDQNSESVSLAGRPAGVYYIHVFGKGGVTNPNYVMTIRTPQAPEATVSLDGIGVFGSRAETFDFGRTAQDSSGPSKVFRVANEGGANLTTSGLSLPAGFTLVEPLSGTIGPGNFDTFTVQLDTDQVGTRFGNVSFNTNDADEGTISFAIEGTVTPTTLTDATDNFGGNDDVFEDNDDRLSVAAAPPGVSNSPNFGVVTNTRLIRNLVMNDAADWFRFQTTTTGTSHDLVRIDFNTTLGNLNLALHDAAGNQLKVSNSANLNFELVTLAGLPAGVYYARVFGAGGATNPRYDLTLAAPGNGDDDPDDAYESNDSRLQVNLLPAGGVNSANLGTLVGERVITGLKLEDTADWFRFQILTPGNIVLRIDFNHLQGDLELQLRNENGGFIAGRDFDWNFDDDFELISRTFNGPRNLPAGTYYARVTGFNELTNEAGQANANYTLTIRPPEADRSLSVSVSPPTNLFESNGSTTGRVTRTGSLAFPLYVRLHSSDITEAQVPNSVLIRPGQNSATFSIDSVNDNRFDEGKLVNIVAWIPGYQSGSSFVTVVPDIIPPVIGSFGDDLEFTENGPAQLIAPLATVTDANSPDFAFGSLNVRFESGGEAGDRLAIRNTATVMRQGGSVLVNGVDVGVWNGGVDGVALTVNFNAQSNASVAQEILRAVTYVHTSESPSATTRVLGVQISDGDGGLSDLATKQILVTPVNDAPVIDTTFKAKLPGVPEDSLSPPGARIHILIKNAVTDPDNTVQRGIAVIGADETNGVWQYSNTGGSTWRSVGNTRSEESALLLPGWYMLRFIPKPDFNGKTTITYRAWDQTAGLPEGKRDLTGRTGGIHAYSAEVATADHWISPVNDAPVLDNSGSPTLDSIKEDTKNAHGTQVWKLVATTVTDVDARARKGIAVVGAPSANGNWQYRLTATAPWRSMGTVYETSALLLTSDAKIRFVPKKDFNGKVTLSYRAWDRTQGTAGAKLNIFKANGGTTAFSVAKQSATLTVTPVNDAPVITVGPATNYDRDTPPVAVAPGGSVKDVDSFNFGGGSLRVRMGVGAGASNRLSLGSGFGVDANNNVLNGTTIIGKRTSNGFGTNELVITFRFTATTPIVQQLLRSISFKTVGGTLGTRTVLFSVNDGDGGQSEEVAQSVTIR